MRAGIVGCESETEEVGVVVEVTVVAGGSA